MEVFYYAHYKCVLVEKNKITDYFNTLVISRDGIAIKPCNA